MQLPSQKSGAVYLGAGNNVVLLRQDVHQLAFALITPLSAQHYCHLGIESLGLCRCC